MNRSILSLAAIALAAASAAAQQANPQAEPNNDDVRTLNIRINDPRPLAAAAMELEQRHGTLISYEDPAYANPADLKNVGAEVRRGFENVPAEHVPALWIPKGGALNFAYQASRATGKPISDADTLQAMLDAHLAAGNAGGFRAVRSGPMIHLIPSSITNEAGISAPVAPVLDANITLARVSGPAVSGLEALCDSVTKATGVTVVPGTFPVNLFAKAAVDLRAENANARETLKALLAQLPGKFSWQLLYDPGLKFYALNIHSID